MNKDELFIVNNPYSSFSEEIKRIRTNIKFTAIDDEVKAIMVTAPCSGDGKSLISGNLAACFAQNDEKTLIIDCDLRRGRQHKVVAKGKKITKGLSKLLIDPDWEKNLESYIGNTNVKGLYIIPSGTFPPNPSELLASNKLLKVLDQLKKYFDTIILDCPPIIGLNDALPLAAYADLSILIANYKKTNMDLLETAKKNLDNVHAKRISVILNRVDRKNNKYYTYNYKYYKGQK